MVLEHYRFNKKNAESAYQLIEEEFSHHVEAAHKMVVSYLKRYDRRRLHIFLGETADPHFDADVLHMGHRMIASMLKEADDSNPAADPQTIDIFARAYLHLPFAVFEGGASS